MVFLEWLAMQRRRVDLVGEFAQQVACRTWPDADSILAFRVRLALEEASPLAYRALGYAWREWQETRELPRVNMVPPRGRN